MDPENDPKLSDLLEEWQLPGAPSSLNAKIHGPRRKWWSFLLTGSVRIPVPAMVVIALILLIMAVALLRQRPAPQASISVNLAEFQPVKDLNFRVIRGSNDSR